MSAGKKKATKTVDPIPEPDLLEDFYECLHRAYRQLREAFTARARTGLSQDDVAAKLDIDKALVSKRLRGLENMTLKTLSYMASALSCRLLIIFQPWEEVPGNNYFFTSGSKPSNKQSAVNAAAPKKAAMAAL